MGVSSKQRQVHVAWPSILRSQGDVLTEVVAVVVDLRVVGHEESRVDSKVAGDQVAVITLLDDVGGLAVLPGDTKADLLVRQEICAAIVDGLVVGDCELVAVVGRSSVWDRILCRQESN